MSERRKLGVPETVGELRELIFHFSNDTPLAVRNAPLATFYILPVEGEDYLEIEIPDVSPTHPQLPSPEEWAKKYLQDNGLLPGDDDES